MVFFRFLLAAFATSASAAPVVKSWFGPSQYATLAGKLYFGTAINIPGPSGELEDSEYMTMFNNSNMFGQATPANIMKWSHAEPEQDVFTFDSADYFVNLVQNQNGYLIRCHNLIWHQDLPKWIHDGNWTKSELLGIVTKRVKKTVAHFGDSCYCWDVLNEALNEDGTYRNDLFYKTTGVDYISTAFKAAQETIEEHGLNVKLYYNDYDIERPGVKSTGAREKIVKFLKDQNIQIDGIGLESHFTVGGTPSTEEQMQNMAAFNNLGVEVAVTELDVRVQEPVTYAEELQQVQDFNSTVAACALTQGCVGVTLWDFDDNYSWIPASFPGWGSGTPWYQANGKGTPLTRKHAYNGIISGFETGFGWGW